MNQQWLNLILIIWLSVLTAAVVFLWLLIGFAAVVKKQADDKTGAALDELEAKLKEHRRPWARKSL